MAGATMKCFTIVGPLIYENRTLYQYLATTSSLFSFAYTVNQGMGPFGLGYFSSVFDAYEFMASDLDIPENLREWTWLDKGKQVVHSALASLYKYIPKSLQITYGNLPETRTYYWLKSSLSNIGTASSFILSARLTRGIQGSNRDVKAAAIFVVAIMALETLVGKYKAQSIQAMLANATAHLKRNEYEKALPSLERLLDTLEEQIKSVKKDPKLQQIWLFVLDNYFRCLDNCKTALVKKEGATDTIECYVQSMKSRLPKAREGLQELMDTSIDRGLKALEISFRLDIFEEGIKKDHEE